MPSGTATVKYLRQDYTRAPTPSQSPTGFGGPLHQSKVFALKFLRNHGRRLSSSGEELVEKEFFSSESPTRKTPFDTTSFSSDSFSMKQTHSNTQSPVEKSAVLELNGVKKSFSVPGGDPLLILDIPFFQIAAGELVALEGQSGSGKSTLLNVISGIMRPDSGQVLVGGLNIVKLAEPQRDRLRADRIGLVFQQFNLLPGFTALENVLVAMSFGSQVSSKERAESLLEAVGLADRFHHKPATMSIGQQQRVAVARALANRPRVLLADEPTASIDPSHQQQVIDLLQTTCREEEVALLVVTHAPEVAEQFPVRHRLEDFNRAAAVHPTTSGV